MLRNCITGTFVTCEITPLPDQPEHTLGHVRCQSGGMVMLITPMLVENDSATLSARACTGTEGHSNPAISPPCGCVSADGHRNGTLHANCN
jgi:hypothetical protein